MKDGLRCEAFLGFVRRLPCAFQGDRECSGGIDAHHFPPRGRGVTRDDFTLPVCRQHHQRCHKQLLPGIPDELQATAVLATRSAFLQGSTDTEMAAYLRARAKRRENLMLVPE